MTICGCLLEPSRKIRSKRPKIIMKKITAKKMIIKIIIIIIKKTIKSSESRMVF